MNRWNHRNPGPFHADQVLVVAASLVLLVVSVCYLFDGTYYVEGALVASRVSGFGALGMLAISILFGPVLRVASWAGLHLDWRVSTRVARDAGIASAILALGHSVISVTGCLRGNWREVFDRSYLYAGFLALVILALLLVFSLKPLMRLVEWRVWKPTFRLSIAAAVLVFGHILYAPFASVRWTMLLYGGAVLLFFLRFLPLRVRDSSGPKEDLIPRRAGNESKPD